MRLVHCICFRIGGNALSERLVIDLLFIFPEEKMRSRPAPTAYPPGESADTQRDQLAHSKGTRGAGQRGAATMAM